MSEATIRIEGMTCGGCVNAVKRVLSKAAGVTVKDVTIGLAVVSFDPLSTSIDALKASIANAGFRAVEATVA
ncbi:MAG: heavy-metal-associated domain-containing protein [Myxococcales bacterium]